MKKIMMLTIIGCLAMSCIVGCLTRGSAYTKRTLPDGTVIESRASIIGIGDKASEVAAEGLFADGTEEDLGAGFKDAKASQQSTGIKETLEGIGSIIGPTAQLAAKTQGVPVASPAVDTAPASAEASSEVVYSSEGYDGAPAAGGVGVYGKTSCARCRAYKAAHPGEKMIDIAVPANRAAMWAALRDEKRKFAGGSVQLPVVITADGYIEAAK